MSLFQAGHRLGGPRARDISLMAEASARIPADPVLKTASTEPALTDDRIAKLAKAAGLDQLRRVAGNVFEHPATRDFWKVADGTLTRLVSSEVDDGEHLDPMPADDPESHIASILADLEY
jgi:hypothetical protein